VSTTTDTTDPAAAPDPEESNPLGTNANDPQADDQDDDAADPSSDDADHGDISKARQQAAKYRARLRETETERDALRDQLDAQRRAVINWRATTTAGGVDPALLDAAGINVAELIDDAGNLDMAAVDQFIDSTATRFKVARGFTPNRAQSAGGAGRAPSLADAFRG
jgi:hypothetical protein